MIETGYLQKILGFQALFDFILILIFLFLIVTFIWFVKVPLSKIINYKNSNKIDEQIITHSNYASKEPETEYKTEHELNPASSIKAKGKKRQAPERPHDISEHKHSEQPQHQETPHEGLTTILSDLEQAANDSKNNFVNKLKCFVSKEKNKIKIKKNKTNSSDTSKLNSLPLNTRNSTTVINYSETVKKTKKKAKKSPKKADKIETIFEVDVTKQQTKSDIVLNELKRNQSNSTVKNSKSDDYLSSISFTESNDLKKTVSNSTIAYSGSDLSNSKFLERNRDKLLFINSSTTNYSDSLNSNHNQTLSHLSEETNWTTQTGIKKKSQLNINDDLNKRIETDANGPKLNNTSFRTVPHINDSSYSTKSILSNDSSVLENKSSIITQPSSYYLSSTNSNVNITKSKFSDESIMTTQTQFRTQESKNGSKLKTNDDPKNPKPINKSFSSIPHIDDSGSSIKSILSNYSENSNHNRTLSHLSEETNWTTQTGLKNKSQLKINDDLNKRIETDANGPKLNNTSFRSVPHMDDSGYITKSLDNSFLENQSLSYISSTNSNVNITKSNFSDESIMTTQTQFRTQESKNVSKIGSKTNDDPKNPKLINKSFSIDDSSYATKSILSNDSSVLENKSSIITQPSSYYLSSTNSNVNITKSNFSDESIMTTQTQFRRQENKIPDLIKDLNEDFSLSQLIVPKSSQTNTIYSNTKTLQDAQSFKSILSNISVSNSTVSESSLFATGLNQKQADLLRTFSNNYSCSNNSNKIFEFGSDKEFKFNIKYDLKSTDSRLNQQSRTESGFYSPIQEISKRPSGLKFNLLKQFVTPIKLNETTLKQNSSTLSIVSSLKSCSLNSLDYTSSAVSSSSDLSARNEFHPNISLHSDSSVEELPEQTCYIFIKGNLEFE